MLFLHPSIHAAAESLIIDALDEESIDGSTSSDPEVRVDVSMSSSIAETELITSGSRS